MGAPTATAVLERLCALLRHETRQRGRAHGLQPVQVEALLYLARCNRYSDTPQVVAEFLGSTKGTASQTLKVLERDGLLVKMADPEDRRVVRLRLTPAGKKLASELAVSPVLEQVLLASGPTADRLAADLQQLLAGMQRSGGHRTFGTCQTCRFFRREGEGFRCGLTSEPLSLSESTRICREHELSENLVEGSP